MAPNLSDESMRKWLLCLPEDIRALVGSDGSASPEFIEKLQQTQVADMPRFVREQAPDIRELGRARRMLLMGWMSRSLIAEGRETDGFFRALMALPEDEQGSGGAGDQVGMLFYEDFIAFATGLGRRRVFEAVNEATLNMAVEAAQVAKEDLMFRGGIV